MKDLTILGVESTCDETACSIVRNGRDLVASVISSQIEIHKPYGGVVPEIASRKHVENIIPVLDECFTQAGTSLDQIDGVAVSYGPGLVGALLTGISVAKAIAWSLDIPLLGVNHIEGHIFANFLTHKDLQPPFLALIVSGGHSHIVYVKDYLKYEIIGKTRDDAAGEAFDKTARVLGLGYPGGPLIDKMAKEGNDTAFDFPKTKFSDNPYDFSFSGIKTAVINQINSMKMKGQSYRVEDVAASFQKAVVDVLVRNTIEAAKEIGMKTVCLAGGVSANSLLRKTMEEEGQKSGIQVYYPDLVYCT
ncbi:MAG TPA: tRNA (adenosine(37)-N6)-threonylcarbamoyltransferase complex transferase subunit TsaD, partial [Clostridiales bacterium]|nr:tRNA (adenosine(37)-N6)-threonylcarbamoyltransferase complex transferase subunit TsaD [Clostridiales bacterium]